MLGEPNIDSDANHPLCQESACLYKTNKLLFFEKVCCLVDIGKISNASELFNTHTKFRRERNGVFYTRKTKASIKRGYSSP